MNENENTKMTASQFRHAFRYDAQDKVACFFGRGGDQWYYGATCKATVLTEGHDEFIANWNAFGLDPDARRAVSSTFKTRAAAFAWLRKQARADRVDINKTMNAFINVF